MFQATEAYLIEGGRITAPVKGAMLIGNGPEALHRITAIGDDLALDNGIGTCGKNGQGVPVGVGQPTLRMERMTVGGTATADQGASAMAVINRIAGFHDDITAWRRHLHAHPELGFQEHATSAFVAEKLREFGVDEIHTGLAETGVVGVIRSGSGEQRDRPARRHGRPADPRGDRPALGFGPSGTDARLRA